MEYEVYYNIKKEEVIDLIKLDYDNYFGSDVGDLESCIKWLEICPEVYTIVKKDKEIIGYINFLPITKDCYEKIKQGNKKDYEISLDDVLDFRIGDNYCLFMSIVLKKIYRKSMCLFFLLNGFKDKLYNLYKKGICIKGVIADCITHDGEKLAKYYNGKFICRTKTGSKIFEFKFNDFLVQ